MRALIMAGGRASRFGKNIEKALIEFNGMTLLERSIIALQHPSITEIFVSVSSNTLLTKAFCAEKGIASIMTSGLDYHKDIYSLLDRFGNFISLNVDIPFISPKDVAKLIDSIDDVSIASVILRENAKFSVDLQSLTKDANDRDCLWVGLNYVTPSKQTELLELDNWLLALNINTPDDLSLAEKLSKDETGR